MKRNIISSFCFAIFIAISPITNGQSAMAFERFNDVYCQSDFEDKDICNVSFHRKFLSAKLIKSGVNIRIPYSSISRWSYENSTLRKRKGIFSTRLEHIHLFTILHRDIDLGTREVLIIDFDNIEYVPPIKSLLDDILPQSNLTKSRN